MNKPGDIFFVVILLLLLITGMALGISFYQDIQKRDQYTATEIILKVNEGQDYSFLLVDKKNKKSRFVSVNKDQYERMEVGDKWVQK